MVRLSKVTWHEVAKPVQWSVDRLEVQLHVAHCSVESFCNADGSIVAAVVERQPQLSTGSSRMGQVGWASSSLDGGVSQNPHAVSLLSNLLCKPA